jgi:hypothetical protein
MLIDLALFAVVVAAATLPFAWPYLEARQRYGFSRSLGDAEAMAAAVESYIVSARRLAIAYALTVVALVAGALRIAARLGSIRVTQYPLTGFVAVAALLAFWLSLGPAPAWRGQAYPSLSLYALVHPFWPGLDAVRVSSRFASIFLVFVAVLTGMGAARVTQSRHAVGVVLVLVLAGALLAANVRRPFPINTPLVSEFLYQPAAYLRPSPVAPSVYRYIKTLPREVVLAEFPFADLWYNTRYLYLSTFHWRRLMNGFTSFYPPTYQERMRWLINPSRTPDEAWLVLRTTGVTHVVLHTGAWDEPTGSKMHGQFDQAVVYELPQK